LTRGFFNFAIQFDSILSMVSDVIVIYDVLAFYFDLNANEAGGDSRNLFVLT